jgi:hypothetical protein
MLGYDAGPIDGIFGRKTLESVVSHPEGRRLNLWRDPDRVGRELMTDCVRARLDRLGVPLEYPVREWQAGVYQSGKPW